MSKSRSFGLAIALVSVLAIAGTILARMLLPKDGLAKDSPRGIEAPNRVDLGAVSLGSIVPASVEIVNQGEDEVVLVNFKPDCSCQQIYRVAGSQKVALDRLQLKPGEHATLATDIRISGDPGGKQASTVAFHDARNPSEIYQIRFLYTPVSRFYTTPRSIALGDVPIGSSSGLRLELRSDGSDPRGLAGIALAPSRFFSVKFAEADVREQARMAQDYLGQFLIGYADLTFDAHGQEAVVNEDLMFLRDGEELGRISASARVVGDYQLSPNPMVLPRAGSMDDAYTATVLCRKRGGEEFAIEPGRVPEDFRIRLAEGEGRMASFHRIVVTYVGSRSRTASTRHELPLTIDGTEAGLTLVVVVAPERPEAREGDVEAEQ